MHCGKSDWSRSSVRFVFFFCDTVRCHFSGHVGFFQNFRVRNVIYWCLFLVGGAVLFPPRSGTRVLSLKSCENGSFISWPSQTCAPPNFLFLTPISRPQDLTLESVVLSPIPSVSDSVSVFICFIVSYVCSIWSAPLRKTHYCIDFCPSTEIRRSAFCGYVAIFSRSCVDPEVARSVSFAPTRALTNIIGAAFGVTAVSVLTESH